MRTQHFHVPVQIYGQTPLKQRPKAGPQVAPNTLIGSQVAPNILMVVTAAGAQHGSVHESLGLAWN